MQDQIEAAEPVEMPTAPTTATRKKRADAGTTRDNIYVYPSPAMRLDLQHAGARQMLFAWLRAESASDSALAVVNELLAHIDRLRKNGGR